MKKVILLLFLTLGIKTASADCVMCAGSGMQFFPEQKEISLNSMFIIQGYAMSQKTITSFNDRSIYLENESGERIELNLQDILKGQMRLTQAIFKPNQKLKPNTTYFLKYADQTENEGRELTKYNRETKKSEAVFWKTTDKKAMASLNSNLTIEYEQTEVVHYGCGPSANTIFNVKNKADSEIWYKTEVIEIETNKKTTYHIREWNGQLNVGHGMCSGAFTFKRTGKYKVRFTPMNTDGNSLQTTEWKMFESPFKNDKRGF